MAYPHCCYRIGNKGRIVETMCCRLRACQIRYSLQSGPCIVGFLFCLQTKLPLCISHRYQFLLRGRSGIIQYLVFDLVNFLLCRSVLTSFQSKILMPNLSFTEGPLQSTSYQQVSICHDSPENFGDISLTKALFRKYFEGETFIRTLSSTPFQICCKIIFNPSNAEATFLQSTRTQIFLKPSKPFHVGIHWNALAECSQMSTHIPGFQSFFRFFASFCIGQISH